MTFTPQMCGVEYQLLDVIRQRGRVECLFSLTQELQIDYPWAHQMIVRLEERGFIRKYRDISRPGTPLIMEACRHD